MAHHCVTLINLTLNSVSELYEESHGQEDPLHPGVVFPVRVVVFDGVDADVDVKSYSV